MESKKNITLFKFIIKHILHYPIAFFFIFFLYGALALERVYFPYLFGNIIDIMNSGIDKANWWANMKLPIITILSITLGMDVIFRIQELITEYYIPRFKANIRREAFEYTMHHSSRFFSENHTGSIAGKINSLTDNIFQIVSKVYNVFAPIGLTILIAMFTVFFINFKIGLVYCVWCFCHFGFTVLSTDWLKNVWEKAAEKNNNVQGKIVDSINNILNVRLFSKQRDELQYYKKYEDENVKYSFYAGVVGIKIRFVLSLIAFFGLGLVTYYTIIGWRDSLITSGEVAAVFAIFVNSVLMLWWLSYELIFFYMEIGVASQAMSLLNEEHEIKNQEDAKDLVIKDDSVKIEFRDVSFHYKGGQEFFKNLNIIILPGQKVGLVGFSGAGKTTFANLIMREFDLSGGQILIDNQDIKTVTLKSLRDNISYITQDINMFHRSVRENIAFSTDVIEDEAIYTATRYASAHDFIEKLDKKYDTIVGEKGAKLSGGQKQRISIARAFLKDAPIIILDEATSALDSVTERQIKDAINFVSKNKTTLIIAHRLSTLRDVDRILVFESGKIIEDGSHGELIQKENGYYKSLWESQNEYFEEDDTIENDLE
jgi:ATP-binding cassette subfamily B protein